MTTRETTETPETVTIVTTCMGRLGFLKRTLPGWLKETSFHVIVVDYSCPDGTSEWIEKSRFGSRVSVVSVEAEIHEGRPVFNLSRARNAGAAEVQGFVCFLDADTGVDPGFESWLMKRLDSGCMYCVVPPRGRADTFGALVVHAEAFENCGGYDEEFTGWGFEDGDLRLRLHWNGIRRIPLPGELLSAIPHENSIRAANYVETDFRKSRSVNFSRFNQKLLQATGHSFHFWWKSRDVQGLWWSGQP